ncbi:hypothetical protein CC86DRAFT_382722 [Ophiobolus disseminans]|uniref:Uncharacterized protein n=1 Tax=Ophiobolus disseminans TaxID=1469910 RepID=A0A6A6ZYW9_9PLEO|nr:hypothetical protein CC86DRAFT_382722 [Ophiobolus disseminans]
MEMRLEDIEGFLTYHTPYGVLRGLPRASVVMLSDFITFLNAINPERTISTNDFNQSALIPLPNSEACIAREDATQTPQLVTRIEALRISGQYPSANEMLKTFFKFTSTYNGRVQYNCSVCQEVLSSTLTIEDLQDHESHHQTRESNTHTIFCCYNFREIVFNKNDAIEHYTDCAELWKPRDLATEEVLKFMALFVHEEAKLKPSNDKQNTRVKRKEHLLPKAIALSEFDMAYNCPKRREVMLISVRRLEGVEVDISDMVCFYCNIPGSNQSPAQQNVIWGVDDWWKSISETEALATPIGLRRSLVDLWKIEESLDEDIYSSYLNCSRCRGPLPRHSALLEEHVEKCAFDIPGDTLSLAECIDP